MTWENASPLEIGWTVPTVVGLVVAGVLLYLSICDERGRRRARVNGIVRLDIQKSIATAVALVVALGALSLIGLIAMATPPNPNVARDPTTAAAAIANPILFCGVDAALVALAVYRLLQRGAVLREMAHAQRRDRRASDPKPRDGALDRRAEAQP